MSAPDLAFRAWSVNLTDDPGAVSARLARRVLLVAVVLTIALMLLAAVGPEGQRDVSLALMANAGAIGAMAATIVALPGTTGLVRRMRIGCVANTTLWTLGMVSISLLSFAGQRMVPSFADLFFIAFILPSAWILAGVVRGRMTQAESIAVYLDNALVFLATAAFLVALVGPTAYVVGGWTGLLIALYPALFLGSAVSTFVTMIETRQSLRSGGTLAFAAGLALVGIGSLEWALRAEGQVEWAGLAPYLFAAGPLVSAYGTLTWTGQPNESPAAEARARTVGWCVGPIALLIMAVASILIEDAQAIEIVLRAIVAVGVVLLLLRLALHLRERGETLAEVRRLAAENERLVARLREELVARERVHARLVDASRMSAVGELAAAVAHEVNNPLTGVLGYADLLLSSATPGTPEYDDLSVIRTEALRVRDRVRALLDFATPRRPELVPTDLADLISVPIGLLRYHLERRGITLDERLVAVPPVPLDPPSIQQVLINVISDVAAAMPTGGRIVVTSGQAGDHVVITIEPIAADLDQVALAASFRIFGDIGPDDGSGIASSLGVLRGHGATIGLHAPTPERTVVEIHIPLAQVTEDALLEVGAVTALAGR